MAGNRFGQAKGFLALVLWAAALSSSGRAFASGTFPAALAEAAQMGDCTPGCIVCHTSNEGTLGTAVQKFAGAMKGEGLMATLPNSVKPAVDGLRADRSDVDGDMVLDIDELASGRNPNVPGDSSVCLPIYGFGCAVPAVRAAPGELGLALFAGAALLVGVRRRGRR